MTYDIKKNGKVLLLTFLITTITCLRLTPTFTKYNWDHTPRIEENPIYFNIDSSPFGHPVRLIFIHHSCGENWLADDNGGLGIALRDNNYFVSDTNYGWGPDSIGDSTDIGQWWLWFRGPDSEAYLNQLYIESEQYSSYTRLPTNPGGENEVIMFKSCFPNSALQGGQNDPVPMIEDNPLQGDGASSPYHTVANAKGIYIDLLEYFKTRQDKLFIAITAPPLIDPMNAENARAFNNWLVRDWLKNYPYKNVFIFDFYNVLTTNAGDPDTNDLNQENGNHHRVWNDAIQHKTDGDNDNNPNVLEYPTNGDDHPSRAGNVKATVEFVPLLNTAYKSFKQTAKPPIETTTPTETPTYSEEDTEKAVETATSTFADIVEEPITVEDRWGDVKLWGGVALALTLIAALSVALYRRKRTGQPDFKYCINCGNKITVKAGFCNKCGMKQEEYQY